jgi:hypothetical protein
MVQYIRPIEHVNMGDIGPLNAPDFLCLDCNVPDQVTILQVCDPCVSPLMPTIHTQSLEY